MSHGTDGRRSRAKVDARVAGEVARAMSALSTESRVLILGRLREQPRSVGDLADAIGMEQSAVSQQLRVLRHLGLVIAERRGRQVFYGLHDSHVAGLLDQAVFHAEHHRMSAAEPLELTAAA